LRRPCVGADFLTAFAAETSIMDPIVAGDIIMEAGFFMDMGMLTGLTALRAMGNLLSVYR